MTDSDWQQRYRDRLATAQGAIRRVRPGSAIFIGTGCAQPQQLVHALVDQAGAIQDARILHLLTMGDAPYADEKYRSTFKINTFFVSENVRDAVARGLADYTPIFLSDIPGQITSGHIDVDVALITVGPPDDRGLCSLGISVDIVKAAVAAADYVIAEVNPNMPRTFGDSFLHVTEIDALVPVDLPIIEAPPPRLDERLRRIGENVAQLVDDGATVECGIGQVPQAVAEFLRDKRDLGIHTEMFGDWMIDLVESGAVTGSRKTINQSRIVASFCMGSRRLYDYIDNNPLFEFHPTEYVNDPFIIARHEKMVAINVALEIDLTGQVCADSLGFRLYSGVGGQVDFIRGAARSPGGKAIIALPSTARDDQVSRIVPALREGAGVVTTRADVHYVVTEYGVAYLHGRSIRERALALISIAHPRFRPQLIRQAKRLGLVYGDQIEQALAHARYPAELETTTTLRDGTQVRVRPVRPTDEDALAEMLYSLSDETVRRRFTTRTRAFPHRNVQQLANVDYEQAFALVAVVPDQEPEAPLIAIAQYYRDPRTDAAEAAFLVHDDWQAKGLGSFLLQHLARIAADRGVRRFDATVLPQNKAMLSVFHASGFPTRTEFDGDVYHLSLDLTPAAG